MKIDECYFHLKKKKRGKKLQRDHRTIFNMQKVSTSKGKFSPHKKKPPSMKNMKGVQELIKCHWNHLKKQK